MIRTINAGLDISILENSITCKKDLKSSIYKRCFFLVIILWLTVTNSNSKREELEIILFDNEKPVGSGQVKQRQTIDG